MTVTNEDRITSIKTAFALLQKAAAESSRVGDLILADLDKALWAIVDEYEL